MTTDVVVAPNPVNGSTSVAVGATVDDGTTGGSSVVAAEYFIDATGTSGAGTPLTGTTGGSRATLTGSIPTAVLAGLGAGNHSVLVHGRDAAGNWGATSSTVLVLDRSGPVVSAPTGAPSPTRGASAVTLGASATDPGTPAASSIAAAEWWDGNDPGPGLAHAMTPADGSFDTPVEAVGASVPTAGLSAGEHVISVRARDLAGNWGQAVQVVVTVTPADLVFADGFESGGLTAWSSATGASSLTVNPAAAMEGRLGLSITLGRSSAYLTDTTPAAEAAYHARLRLDATAASPGTRTVDVLVGLTSSGVNAFRIQYRRSSGVSQLRSIVARRSGTTTSAWFSIPSGSHGIEVAWQAGTAATFSVSLDGQAASTLSALDTSQYRLESLRLGPSAGLGTGVSGTLLIDGFVSSRTSVIGP